MSIFNVIFLFIFWLFIYFIFIYSGVSLMVNLTTHKDFKSLKRGDKFKYVLSVIGAVIVSLYLLIAGIMFPVLISQKNNPKASADSLSYDFLMVRFGEFDFIGFLYPDVESHKTGVIFSSDYDYSGDIASFNIDLSGYSYGESDTSFYAYTYAVSQMPTSDSFLISYYYTYSFIPYSELSDVLAVFDDPTLDAHLSDGSYAFSCTFVFSDCTIVLTDYLPVNEYTSSFTLRIDSSQVVSDVGDTWTSIGSWLSATVNNVVSVFYVDGNLTFLGILALVALGISLFFLFMGLLEGFLHLRS